MGKTNTTIEINGKRYDANTGELLFDTPAAAKAKPSRSATHAKSAAKPDVRPAKPKAKATKPAASTSAAQVATPSGTRKPVQPPAASSAASKAAAPLKQVSMHDVVRRRPATSAVRHQPAPSKTLVRRTVKKPSPSLKRSTKTHSSTDKLAAALLGQISTKAAASRLDTHRANRAQHIKKSQLVQHFSKTAATGTSQPALGAPAPAAAHTPTSQVRKPDITARRPAVAKTDLKPKTTADLLEKALQNARSHEQPAYKPPKRRSKLKRRAGLAAGAVLSVAAIGFFISQNIPNAVMHMASARAGFQASLPDYKPAGYAMGTLNSSNGQIAARYISTSNDSSYTVVQKRTSWDSQALLTSIVKPADPNYQTVETGGRTIFIYGKHSATWVSGGVWYQIQSSGSLSDRQLIDIANSL